jgi:hypothetical protein
MKKIRKKVLGLGYEKMGFVRLRKKGFYGIKKGIGVLGVKR